MPNLFLHLTNPISCAILYLVKTLKEVQNMKKSTAKAILYALKDMGENPAVVDIYVDSKRQDITSTVFLTALRIANKYNSYIYLRPVHYLTQKGTVATERTEIRVKLPFGLLVIPFPLNVLLNVPVLLNPQQVKYFYKLTILNGMKKHFTFFFGYSKLVILVNKYTNNIVNMNLEGAGTSEEQSEELQEEIDLSSIIDDTLRRYVDFEIKKMKQVEEGVVGEDVYSDLRLDKYEENKKKALDGAIEIYYAQLPERKLLSLYDINYNTIFIRHVSRKPININKEGERINRDELNIGLTTGDLLQKQLNISYNFSLKQNHLYFSMTIFHHDKSYFISTRDKSTLSKNIKEYNFEKHITDILQDLIDNSEIPVWAFFVNTKTPLDKYVKDVISS